jgi:hypothetical protein
MTSKDDIKKLGAEENIAAEKTRVSERKAVPLRLSTALYDSLARWAAEDFRSVNAQIEYLLNECVKKREGRDPREEIRNRAMRPMYEMPENDDGVDG